MPDPSPEQPPSWPPVSEPTAKSTDPPRITARGVGHLPSTPPEEEDAPGASGHESSADDYADLAPSPHIPNQAPEYSPTPPEPELPRRRERSEPPDTEWPPRENREWMDQQSRAAGWDAGGAAPWPGPTGDEQASQSPAYPSDPYLRDDTGSAPFGTDPYEARGHGAAGPRPDPAAGESFFGDQGQDPGANPFFPEAAPDQPGGSFFDDQPGGSFFDGQPSLPQQSGHRQSPHATDPHGPEPAYDEARYDETQYGQSRYSGPERTETPPSEPEPAPSEPEPSAQKVSAPPTHQGVRYAIYGIGGIITLGLIIAIVVMLGGPPASEPSDDSDGGSDGGTGTEVAEGLDAERYSQLAENAGSAEWFEYRYGDAGENPASEEIAALDGGADQLYGDADRSVQGQLAYVTDDDALSGVDHVTVLESTDEEIGVEPRSGGRFSDEGTPELELDEGSTADCLGDLDGDLGRPVAMARPDQSDEADAHSVIAFSGGVLATAGISGAQGGTCARLPDGQVPTDVAMTDGNELALVTTWRPEDQAGTLVVVAMGDKAGSYNSSWSESYPGLPNPGHFGSAEVIGEVAMPFGAPTSVDAWSDSSGSISTGRTTVDEEPHADTVATDGTALVGSLSESQVVTVDLTEVLTGLAAQHLEGADFEFSAETSDAADFDGGVADVALHGQSLAVATGDGLVQELDGELSQTDSVEVGANPTCLVVGQQSGGFIATSRGESAVRWVEGGEVTDELTDARLTDPVCAGETPAIDVQGYDGDATALFVTDYGGQELHSYLIGTATLPDGSELGDGIAYGGSYEVSGDPFAASVTVDLE